VPRSVSRRYQPILSKLKTIINDESVPLPLQLRSIELSLAILSGVWEVASTRATKKAVRQLIASDAIDRQLLEATGIQQQQAPAMETPEAEIDALIAQAEAERKQKQ
jgi:hypothetical protein